jgi:hypothetical protein
LKAQVVFGWCSLHTLIEGRAIQVEGTGSMTQAVELLLCESKTLSSRPHPTKPNQTKQVENIMRQAEVKGQLEVKGGALENCFVNTVKQ